MTVSHKVVLLAAVDTSDLAIPVLIKAAEIARRSHVEVVVVHVLQEQSSQSLASLQTQTQRLMIDVQHHFVTVDGAISEAILTTADQYQVSEIIMGKRGHRPWQQVFVGSVSRAVLATSSIPVLLVEPKRV